MKEAFMVAQVQCQSCQAVVQGPMFVRSKEQIEEFAAFAHSQTKLLCLSPRLIAVYSPCLVSDEIALEKDETQETPKKDDAGPLSV